MAAGGVIVYRCAQRVSFDTMRGGSRHSSSILPARMQLVGADRLSFCQCVCRGYHPTGVGRRHPSRPRGGGRVLAGGACGPEAAAGHQAAPGWLHRLQHLARICRQLHHAAGTAVPSASIGSRIQTAAPAANGLNAPPIPPSSKKGSRHGSKRQPYMGMHVLAAPWICGQLQHPAGGGAKPLHDLGLSVAKQLIFVPG